MKESNIRRTKSKGKIKLEDWLERVYNDCLKHHTLEFGQMPLLWQNRGKYSSDELKKQLKEELVRQEALKSALAVTYISRTKRAEWLVCNHNVAGDVESVKILIARREAEFKKLRLFNPLQKLVWELAQQE